MTFVDELNKRDDDGLGETYALRDLSGRVMKAIKRACEDNRQQRKICGYYSNWADEWFNIVDEKNANFLSEYYNHVTRTLLPYNQSRLKEFIQNDIRKLGFTDFEVNLLPSEETVEKGTSIFGKPKL